MYLYKHIYVSIFVWHTTYISVALNPFLLNNKKVCLSHTCKWNGLVLNCSFLSYILPDSTWIDIWLLRKICYLDFFLGMCLCLPHRWYIVIVSAKYVLFQKRIFADLVGQLAGIIPGTITAISDAVKNGGKVRAFSSLLCLSATIQSSKIGTLATLYQHGLTDIRAWPSNRMHDCICVISYPLIIPPLRLGSIE